MATITELTVIPASEITDIETFNRVVKAFTDAGYPTDDDCTVFPNKLKAPYFGMGAFAIGWLVDGTDVISVADLP